MRSAYSLFALTTLALLFSASVVRGQTHAPVPPQHSSSQGTVPENVLLVADTARGVMNVPQAVYEYLVAYWLRENGVEDNQLLSSPLSATYKSIAEKYRILAAETTDSAEKERLLQYALSFEERARTLLLEERKEETGSDAWLPTPERLWGGLKNVGSQITGGATEVYKSAVSYVEREVAPRLVDTTPQTFDGSESEAVPTFSKTDISAQQTGVYEEPASGFNWSRIAEFIGIERKSAEPLTAPITPPTPPVDIELGVPAGARDVAVTPIAPEQGSLGSPALPPERTGDISVRAPASAPNLSFGPTPPAVGTLPQIAIPPVPGSAEIAELRSPGSPVSAGSPRAPLAEPLGTMERPPVVGDAFGLAEVKVVPALPALEPAKPWWYVYFEKVTGSEPYTIDAVGEDVRIPVEAGGQPPEKSRTVQAVENAWDWVLGATGGKNEVTVEIPSEFRTPPTAPVAEPQKALSFSEQDYLFYKDFRSKREDIERTSKNYLDDPVYQTFKRFEQEYAQKYPQYVARYDEGKAVPALGTDASAREVIDLLDQANRFEAGHAEMMAPDLGSGTWSLGASSGNESGYSAESFPASQPKAPMLGGIEWYVGGNTNAYSVTPSAQFEQNVFSNSNWTLGDYDTVGGQALHLGVPSGASFYEPLPSVSADLSNQWGTNALSPESSWWSPNWNLGSYGTPANNYSVTPYADFGNALTQPPALGVGSTLNLGTYQPPFPPTVPVSPIGSSVSDLFQTNIFAPAPSFETNWNLGGYTTGSSGDTYEPWYGSWDTGTTLSNDSYTGDSFWGESFDTGSYDFWY